MAPLATSSAPTHQPPAAPQVSLGQDSSDSQPITGRNILTASGVPKCSFFGRIPYAQPPVGELRFRKPRPLPDAFNYTNYGGKALQSGTYDAPCVPCPQTPSPSLSKPGQEFSEDCLKLNIWVPLETSSSRKPASGWPVFFYLHGGFLQTGSPSLEDPSTLISDPDLHCRCIVVAPAYRVGILGFLASREVCGQSGERSANFGLWDQRVALEWTARYISAFGGDAGCITVGGLSAGSYSAFLQLCYDLRLPREQRLIRRVCQWSNGCGAQPRPVFEMQQSFQELMDVLGVVNPNGSAVAALDALREKTAQELLTAVPKLKNKFFRPVTDGSFVAQDTMARLKDGRMAQAMREGNVQLLIGDLAKESALYGTVYPPVNWPGLVDRLSWDFARHVAEAVARPYKGKWKLMGGWGPVFGKLYAKMQVHATCRGQVDTLVQTGLPASSVLRYRIEWRSETCQTPKAMGPTHGTDLVIWFVGNGTELPRHEYDIVAQWMKPVGAFICGRDIPKVQWGTQSAKEVRLLTAEGEIKIRDDPIWEEMLQFWNTLQLADKPQV